MAELRSSAVAVRFRGDDLDPDTISKALGHEPAAGVTKGGTWFTPKGKPMVARTGGWRLEVERRTPGDLDGQIGELFELLTMDLHIWRDLSARFRGELFAGLFMAESNEGLLLGADALAAVAARGLRVDFDIYGPEAKD